jgi:ABC-2 type transport system ATP-binding protein
MTTTVAIAVEDLFHHYGQRRALNGVSFSIEAGELFAIVGPNGGGKTTLFRVLTTLILPQRGSVQVGGLDVRDQVAQVRRFIGVVFQAASLDRKLTVLENLRQQAALYGVSRAIFRQRSEMLLSELGLIDRQRDLVETLSGGLRRRVELAKGMIHRPRLLLMDEPTTGLDPGVRSDLWRYLYRLRDDFAVTIVLTTHLLEEAERADRLAIMNQGEIVAMDKPAVLRDSVGGDSITIDTSEPAALAAKIRERFGIDAAVIDGSVRLEQPAGHTWVPRLAAEFPDQTRAIHVGRPSLEDVFISRTGHRFWQESRNGSADKSSGRGSGAAQQKDPSR